MILDPKKDTKTGLKAKKGEDKCSKLDTIVTNCIALYFTLENMLKWSLLGLQENAFRAWDYRDGCLLLCCCFTYISVVLLVTNWVPIYFNHRCLKAQHLTLVFCRVTGELLLLGRVWGEGSCQTAHASVGCWRIFRWRLHWWDNVVKFSLYLTLSLSSDCERPVISKYKTFSGWTYRLKWAVGSEPTAFSSEWSKRRQLLDMYEEKCAKHRIKKASWWLQTGIWTDLNWFKKKGILSWQWFSVIIRL